ncbi:hypothetical protein [Kitasatospora sp. NPDC047058]|uniref:hypothetical protein n=1 Tax=Kitasatospora sp. NPDC047058 TaxID=3155620 RepID=UPI0033FA9E80
MTGVERWALQGESSRELLTWRGRVLVHNSRPELEFLITGARPVRCPRDIPNEHTIPLQFHPQFQHHCFPLRREDYR